MDNILIIPSYKPDNNLLILAQSLINIKYLKLIIVDNGNGYASQDYFRKLNNLDNVTIVKVKTNKGKGFGIKKGIEYIMSNSIKCKNIIFADADGQHTFNDIKIVIQSCNTTNMKNKFIIGNRKHTTSTPVKNLIGNKIFNFLIKLMKNIKHNDCLCGLRAISRDNCQLLLDVNENDFDFEITSIFYLIKNNILLGSVNISATYYQDHKSHFKDIKNSWQLIKLVFK